MCSVQIGSACVIVFLDKLTSSSPGHERFSVQKINQVDLSELDGILSWCIFGHMFGKKNTHDLELGCEGAGGCAPRTPRYQRGALRTCFVENIEAGAGF